MSEITISIPPWLVADLSPAVGGELRLKRISELGLDCTITVEAVEHCPAESGFGPCILRGVGHGLHIDAEYTQFTWRRTTPASPSPSRNAGSSR